MRISDISVTRFYNATLDSLIQCKFYKCKAMFSFYYKW